jgi:hypothetical protein
MHIALMRVSGSFQIDNAVWIALSFHVPGPGPEWEVATVSMGGPSRFPFGGCEGLELVWHAPSLPDIYRERTVAGLQLHYEAIFQS